jgi:hypothetical protein
VDSSVFLGVGLAPGGCPLRSSRHSIVVMTELVDQYVGKLERTRLRLIPLAHPALAELFADDAEPIEQHRCSSMKDGIVSSHHKSFSQAQIATVPGS